MHRVYLGLGSNMGNREALLQQAMTLIDERVGDVTRRSSLIETEPWGFQSQNRFLNAVVCCETELSPRQLLHETQQIERLLGRKRKTVSQYADRPIDIDILLYDDLTVDEPDLKIPHPLMYERDFVMIPLKEIYNN
ncbi:MAG: 2-amino-4-hydroxy-6-hydroxymethyldihydropteridine diphosphokinase [Prevotella sp.]|nr:2-amino-4-hydroxy-6-hydroxymethyldihydropteridine diphosphokinase [Prevotella sp.]